jgi:tetratricopeptide (TPR) repeat protein
MNDTATGAAAGDATRVKRYPGSRPFDDTVADRLIFFGRKEEILALSNRILGARLILLFARSGVGKTSLLSAGVAPRLREHALLPVPILLTDFLTAARAGSAGSPTDRVIDAVVAACATQGLRLVAGERTGLWEFFKTSLIWQQDTLLTPVLVFDQFEEIFTLTKDRDLRRRFAREIGSLLQTGYPERLVERMMNADSDHRLSDQWPNVKVVLSLREEFLGALQDLSTEIPGLFKERFRLATMTREQAREAILSPAALATPECGIDFATAPFDIGEDLLTAMLDFLKGQSEVIEPFQLQLLCSHLEATFAPPADKPRAPPIGLAQTGGSAWMGEVVRDFYTAALRQLPAGQRKRARLLCEDGLLTREGFRQMLPEAVIRNEWKCSAETLRQLVDRHLLRTEQRLESLFYEISHDSIARTIHLQRRWHLPRHVKTGIWVASAFTLIVVAILIRGTIQARTMARETANANEEADKLIGYLIAGDLPTQLRAFGSTDLLDQLEDKVRVYLPDVDDSVNLIHRENHALARLNDGDLLVTTGHLEQALANYESARTAFEQMHANVPDNPDVTAGLATSIMGIARTLASQGHLSDAVPLMTSAVVLRESLVGVDPSKDYARTLDEAEARQTLALQLMTQEQLAAAHKQLDLSIARLAGLGAKTAHDRRATELFADGYADIGELYYDELFEPGAARSAYAKSETYVDDLGKRFSLSAKARMMQIIALNRNALLLVDEDANKAKARQSSIDAQHMISELTDWDPRNLPWQRDWAVNLTVVADMSGNGVDEAKRSYESAIQKLEELVSRDPSNVDWKLDLARARDSYGRYLGNSASDWPAALKQFDAAMPIFDSVADADPGNIDVRLSRDVELTMQAEFERRRGGDRDLQTRLLRKAMDSIAETQKAATDSVRAIDAMLYAQRVSCMTVRPEQRPRATECLEFTRNVEEQVKAPAPESLTSNIWNNYTWLEDGAATSGDKVALYRNVLRVLAIAVGRRPGDEENLDTVENAIQGTSGATEAALRTERLNLVRAAAPGELTGVRRGSYLERVHDLYVKLNDKNAALVELRRAIDANPAEPRLYEKSAQLHFLLGQDLLASNFQAAQSEYQSSIEAQQKCVELAPGDQARRRSLWQRHIDIGNAVKGVRPPESKQRVDFAQAQYARASELLQHEIKQSPSDDTLYKDLFNLIGWQFRVDWDSRNRAGAWEAYQNGITAAQKAIDLQPNKPDYWHLLQEAHLGVGLSVSYWDEANADWRTRARAALQAAADASRKSIEKDPELPKLRGYFEEIATSLGAAAKLMEKDSLRDDAARTYAEACSALDHATALTPAAAAKTKSNDSDDIRALKQRCAAARH